MSDPWGNPFIDILGFLGTVAGGMLFNAFVIGRKYERWVQGQARIDKMEVKFEELRDMVKYQQGLINGSHK